MGKRNVSGSIAFKLAVVFIFFAVFQSILLASLMISGGVLKQAKANQYSIFAEKVNGRSDNLENQMKNIWTNLDYDAEQISQYFETMEQEGAPENADAMLEELAPMVIDTLFRVKTTGVFLVMPDQGRDGDGALPALYLRNNNPDRSSRENSNLYMLVGPWNVAEKLEIATTANWSFRLNMNESNRDFVYKPYEAALDHGKSKWLGYWSSPFQVNPQDEDVITYSTPLFGADGKVKAIFGVEISVNYLYRFLPASDLQTSDSYGYIIGIRDGAGDIKAAVTHGAMQRRMLEEGMPLDLVGVDQGNSIYRLLNHKSSGEVYACMNPMGMYYHNTPFEGEEWFLIGLMEGPDLHQFPEKIGRILSYSFLLSLIIGFITAIITSQWFTRHAKLIELAGLPVGAFEMRAHSKRVYMTSQVPRLLNLTREQERRFSRDKDLMCAFLRELESSESGEEGVFRMHDKEETRWIKIARKTSGSPIRCIVEDVTDEVLQTKALRKERDWDGLTGVKNRMAFGETMVQMGARRDEYRSVALVMCDLNDLKGVNDVFGHDKGDEYICAAAGCIRKAFPSGHVFRIGGDEFAVILTDVWPDEAREGIKVLAAGMEEYSRGSSFDASVAAGIAFYDPGMDAGLDNTLSRADADMYSNKREMKQ